MKNRLLRMMILTVFIALVQGCGNTMEKDARNLAGIQKQKSEMVRNMLSSRDSLQKIQLLDEIKRLETRYAHESKQYREKYCDSADQAAFEEYYRECLKSTTN